MDQSFDPTIPGYMEGTVGAVVVSEPATFPPPALRRLVVNPDQPFDIKVEWEIFGAFVPLWLAPAGIGPNWNVAVFAESIGPGPEVELGSTTVPKGTPDPADPNRKKYSATVTVPPGTITEDVNGASGTYKLVATVFLNSILGTPGFDLTGFSEGPIIRAENPI
jgi:hypothetical protein